MKTTNYNKEKNPSGGGSLSGTTGRSTCTKYYIMGIIIIIFLVLVIIFR